MAPKATKTAAPPAGAGSQFEVEADKWTKVIGAAADRAPEKVRPYVSMAAPILAKLIAALIIAWPYIVKYTALAREYYAMLPHQVIMLIVGAVCCFFGGMFPATIAAVEAWRLSGGKEAIRNLKLLLDEANKVKKAEDADDQVDADNDGVPDVQQIDGKELLQRKMMIVAQAVDPTNVNLAVGGLYTGWIGVVAVLKIKFAKTVTLGAKIGDAINTPVLKYAGPVCKKMVGEENDKWVPVVLSWCCRAVAISLAWWLTRIISGFHSAIRGGQVMSLALFTLLKERGIFVIDPEQSHLDEIAGWSFAFIGFLFQWNCGFSVPTLFSLFLWPVQFIESFIVWQVSN